MKDELPIKELNWVDRSLAFAVIYKFDKLYPIFILLVIKLIYDTPTSSDPIELFIYFLPFLVISFASSWLLRKFLLEDLKDDHDYNLWNFEPIPRGKVYKNYIKMKTIFEKIIFYIRYSMPVFIISSFTFIFIYVTELDVPLSAVFNSNEIIDLNILVLIYVIMRFRMCYIRKFIENI